jgi:hypothetical protein
MNHKDQIKSKILSFASSAAIAGALGITLFAGAQASALTFDQNVPKATQDQMTVDLAFVGSLTGAKVSALHQSVYGPMAANGYTTWFNARVKKVGYDASESGGAVAYVAPFLDSTKMVLTKNFTQFNHPQIARMMVVFHEARHTEDANGNWPHATCPQPFLDDNGNEIKSIWTGLPLAGLDGCDDAAIGAYGSSLIMMKNVSLNCDNCTDKVKMDAGIYADDQFKRIIDHSAHDQINKDLYVKANP